jgi:hypothetical protein
MDESEDRRPRSIEDITEFFHDGDYNSRRDVQALQETLQEEFFEWHSEQISEAWSAAEAEAVKEYIEENDWDFEDKMRTYMEEVMELTDDAIDEAMAWYGAKARGITSSRQQAELMRTDQSYTNFAEARDAVEDHLNEYVQESIDSQDRNYDRAREQWEEDVRDNYDEGDWLRDSEYSYMTDVSSQHDINWPYWTDPESSEGGFSEDNARQLARSMEAALDVKTKVAGGYHSVSRKPGLWIFEPDSSLEPDDTDDMPVEIISPPLPLSECLSILPNFWQWAKSHDAYSNSSTGFHIGVSLPIQGGNVDYMKLALFLGDQYVLDEFGRGANTFAKSSVGKLKTDLSSGAITAAQVADTLKLMRANLIELADRTIKRGGGKHGKYTSINMKGGYIEFRSMGDEKYFTDPESLKRVLDTVKRYAYAMHIAGSPELFRDEYAKKLYKLLDTGENSATVMQEFSEYVAGIGGADAQTVKSVIRSLHSGQYADAPLPDRQTPARTGSRSAGEKHWWNVQWDNNRRMEVVAANKEEAKQVAAAEWGMTGGDPQILARVTAAWTVTYLRPFKGTAA